MFCKNCGKEIVGNPQFCPNCGANLSAPAEVVKKAKDKVASILLAVFLSFWTWLYTYKKDAWKFWLGLGLNIFALPLAIVLGIFTFGIGAIIILAPFGIWVWAIVDVCLKSEKWYNSY